MIYLVSYKWKYFKLDHILYNPEDNMIYCGKSRHGNTIYVDAYVICKYNHENHQLVMHENDNVIHCVLPKKKTYQNGNIQKIDILKILEKIIFNNI